MKAGFWFNSKKIFFMKLVFLMSLLFFLQGCGELDRLTELENYIEKVKSSSLKEIDPLPVFKEPEQFSYSDEMKRSPFVAYKKSINAEFNKPDQTREKMELEAFPLDTLRLVGILKKHKEVWAIVVSPNDVAHRVKVGDYLGQNYGQVQRITNAGLTLIETIVKPGGDWHKRDASMLLIDE